MRQSRFVYVGVLELLLAGALVALFGPVVLTGSHVVALLVVAGVAAVLAGCVAAIELGAITVTWRHLVAASYLAFAVMWPLVYAPHVLAGTASVEDLLMFGVAVTSALVFAFVGFDIARDGRHFEVTPNVDRVLAL